MAFTFEGTALGRSGLENYDLENVVIVYRGEEKLHTRKALCNGAFLAAPIVHSRCKICQFFVVLENSGPADAVIIQCGSENFFVGR